MYGLILGFGIGFSNLPRWLYYNRWRLWNGSSEADDWAVKKTAASLNWGSLYHRNCPTLLWSIETMLRFTKLWKSEIPVEKTGWANKSTTLSWLLNALQKSLPPSWRAWLATGAVLWGYYTGCSLDGLQYLGNTRSALDALEYKIRKESKLHIVYHLHVAGELTGRRQINLGTRTMVFSLTWEPEKNHQTQVQPTNFSLVKSCYPSVVFKTIKISSPTDFVPFPPGTWGRFDMSALAGFGGSEDQTIWIDDINCQGTTTFLDGCVGTKLSN